MMKCIAQHTAISNLFKGVQMLIFTINHLDGNDIIFHLKTTTPVDINNFTATLKIGDGSKSYEIDYYYKEAIEPDFILVKYSIKDIIEGELEGFALDGTVSMIYDGETDIPVYEEPDEFFQDFEISRIDRPIKYKEIYRPQTTSLESFVSAGTINWVEATGSPDFVDTIAIYYNVDDGNCFPNVWHPNFFTAEQFNEELPSLENGEVCIITDNPESQKVAIVFKNPVREYVEYNDIYGFYKPSSLNVGYSGTTPAPTAIVQRATTSYLDPGKQNLGRAQFYPSNIVTTHFTALNTNAQKASYVETYTNFTSFWTQLRSPEYTNFGGNLDIDTTEAVYNASNRLDFYKDRILLGE